MPLENFEQIKIVYSRGCSIFRIYQTLSKTFVFYGTHLLENDSFSFQSLFLAMQYVVIWVSLNGEMSKCHSLYLRRGQAI